MKQISVAIKRINASSSYNYQLFFFLNIKIEELHIDSILETHTTHKMLTKEP